jgi:tRNA pseudouridine55 synthase
MDGIILINKPKGWTSFDVVAKVRSVLRIEAQKKLALPQGAPNPKPKVGHTGTLDPLATGLLIIVTGSYCKRAEEFTKLDKWYHTEVTLGITSTTDDEEGKKTKINHQIPDFNTVQTVLATFLGTQSQLPPAFSAIKIDGQRAYKLARQGQAVKMEPRTITIYELTNIHYDYPQLTFDVKVSSGTYIRSLARDIGQKLGTGAYMSGLVRTQVGNFQLADAVAIEAVTTQMIRKP